MTELLTLSRDASHPSEITHLGRLYPRSRPFGHHPTLMTIGEDRNEDRPVDRELCLAAQLSFRYNGAVKRTQYPPAAPILRPISRSIVPSLSNKTPRYLNSGLQGVSSLLSPLPTEIYNLNMSLVIYDMNRHDSITFQIKDIVFAT